MPGKREQMQKLMELKERIGATITQHQRAIEALQNQLVGVDTAMKVLGAEGGTLPTPRRNVKRMVLEVVQEAGKVGVTASEVISRAAAKGRALNAGSVASLLSRLKQDQILTFDGERYYLASPQGSQEPIVKIVKTANGG
jgi:hypothetical protein